MRASPCLGFNRKKRCKLNPEGNQNQRVSTISYSFLTWLCWIVTDLCFLERQRGKLKRKLLQTTEILEWERDKAIVFIKLETPVVHKRISITASGTLAFLPSLVFPSLKYIIIHSTFTTKQICYLKHAMLKNKTTP